MSTSQRIHVRTLVVVDREIADVLRLEAKKVLMFGHDYFEDYLDFCPEAQESLALRYRNAIDLIFVLGFDPEKADPTTESFEVWLTDDLVDQLRRRRYDLGLSNVDRLPEDNGPISPELLAEITVDRLAAQALDRLFGAYARAVKA